MKETSKKNIKNIKLVLKKMYKETRQEIEIKKRAK